MTDSQDVDQSNGDDVADAFAATLVIAIVIAAVVFWLAGMPS